MTTEASSALSTAEQAAARVVPGRECGSCTLCCKLIAVKEFNKPPGVWCPHCIKSGGCAIHATRPTGCRTFFCHWMLERSVPADWKPERVKFALVTSEGGHMTAFVDPGFPSAWRKSPYFETLKRWALDGLRAAPARIVSVRIGTRGIVILPDREIDIGNIGPNDSIMLEPGPGGSVNVRKFERTAES